MNVRLFNGVRTSGLTNTDSADYGELATSRKPFYKGYCTSRKCCEYWVPCKRRVRIDGEVYKTLKIRDKTFVTSDNSMKKCPECGNGLIWFKFESSIHAHKD